MGKSTIQSHKWGTKGHSYTDAGVISHILVVVKTLDPSRLLEHTPTYGHGKDKGGQSGGFEGTHHTHQNSQTDQSTTPLP